MKRHSAFAITGRVEAWPSGRLEKNTRPIFSPTLLNF